VLGVGYFCCTYCRLCVGHYSEPCKNGWTDLDAVWSSDSGWPKESCTMWVHMGTIMGISRRFWHFIPPFPCPHMSTFAKPLPLVSVHFIWLHVNTVALSSDTSVCFQKSQGAAKRDPNLKKNESTQSLEVLATLDRMSLNQRCKYVFWENHAVQCSICS